MISGFTDHFVRISVFVLQDQTGPFTLKCIIAMKKSTKLLFVAEWRYS